MKKDPLPTSRRFKKKRVTTLVRVRKKWIPLLKENAKEKGKTLSKLHDDIYKFYLKYGNI